MTWEIEYTDEFGDWWSGHSERFMHSIPDVTPSFCSVATKPGMIDD